MTPGPSKYELQRDLEDDLTDLLQEALDAGIKPWQCRAALGEMDRCLYVIEKQEAKRKAMH